VDRTDVAQEGRVASSCEDGNGASGPIKDEEFLDQPRNHQILCYKELG
jgi:hypothetical protein